MLDLRRDQPHIQWPDEPRQGQLRASYQDNVSAGKAPYEGVRIHTLGEVLWLEHIHDWEVSSDPSGKERLNLSGADLSLADLRGAILVGANLSRAILGNADLSKAVLLGSNLQKAALINADLTGTNLSNADLRGALLNEARFGGADLRVAKLQGADMRRCYFDQQTILFWAHLDCETKLGDVVWNGAPLKEIMWDDVPKLGDEVYVCVSRETPARIAACRDVARAYRQLSLALRSQGLLVPASRYRLREERLERQALHLERKYGQAVFSGLLDLVVGYGEMPWRAVKAYLTVVCFFIIAYALVAHFDIDQRLRHVEGYEWIALSVTSFHGRGFFPGVVPPHPWITWLTIGEAIIGLFLELVFIATFTRRFLGN